MSENLPKLFVETFTTLLNLKLQQRTSKLRGRVMEGFHIGKQASPIQYIGAIQMKAPTGRFAPIQRQDVDFTRRWVLPVDREAFQLIDSFDKLKILMDPTSQYSDVAAAAVAREWDDRIIGAAFATAQIGDTTGVGLTTETFSTTLYQIAATFGSSAGSGLTVAKMIETKRVFRKAQVEVDTEPLTWVTNSQGEADLLNQVQVVSSDFSGADRPTLVDGKVTRFMGFDLVYSERLTSDSTNRQNIALVKSGAYLGIWKDTENSIDRRVDLSSLPYQLATLMSSGATRLEPARLLQVLCADSSAAADVTP
jgi:Phage capsid protein